MISPTRLAGPAQLVLDLNLRVVTVGGTAVALGQREVDLLEVLLTERGRVVPFEELAERAWGHGAAGDQRFIYTATWRLRRALAAAGAPDVVQGVRSVGYLIADGGDDVLEPARALAIFDPGNPNLAPLMANEAALQMIGHDLETLTTLSDRSIKLWSPEDRAILDELVEEAMEQGAAEGCGLQLVRAGGETVAVDLSLFRLDVLGEKPQMLAEVRLHQKSDKSLTG